MKQRGPVPPNWHSLVSVLKTQTKKKYFWLQVYVFIVSAVAVVSCGVIETRTEKRGLLTASVLSGHGYSLGLDHSYGLGLSLGERVGPAAGPDIGVAAGSVSAASPVTVTSIRRKVPVPVPQAVPVTKNHPFHVDVPSVDLPRPFPLAVPQPVPVTVVRPVPVNVPRPVAAPVNQPVPVHVTALQPIPIAQPVALTVPQPVSLTLHQPVAVPVPQPSVAFEGLRIGGFAFHKGLGLPDYSSYVPSSLISYPHGASYGPSYFSSY